MMLNKCQICKTRKVKINYAESMLDYTHGFKTPMCRQCYVQMLRERIITINENIIEQEQLIIKGR